MFSLRSINRLQESIFFLGPSGTGKSFTVNFYLGLYNELFKAVVYPNESVERLDWEEWEKKIDEIEWLLLASSVR